MDPHPTAVGGDHQLKPGAPPAAAATTRSSWRARRVRAARRPTRLDASGSVMSRGDLTLPALRRSAMMVPDLRSLASSEALSHLERSVLRPLSHVEESIQPSGDRDATNRRAPDG